MEIKVPLDESRIITPKEAYDCLICFVCLSISENPLLLKCCECITCSKCINDCIKKQNKCPKCRHESPQKEVPNKFILRLFSNLRVKCIYDEKGCKEVVSYDCIDEHEKTCQFNFNRINKCENCLVEFPYSAKDSHECVKELVRIVGNLTKKLESLSLEHDTLKKSSIIFSNSNSVEVPKDKKEMIEDIVSNLRIHGEHPLVKSMRINYFCDCCRTNYRQTDSYYCSACDFDLCIRCFSYMKGRIEDNR